MENSCNPYSSLLRAIQLNEAVPLPFKTESFRRNKRKRPLRRGLGLPAAEFYERF